MNSLTITPQGPASGRRQGRSRALSSNQSMTGAWRGAPWAGPPSEGPSEGVLCGGFVGAVMAYRSCHGCGGLGWCGLGCVEGVGWCALGFVVGSGSWRYGESAAGRAPPFVYRGERGWCRVRGGPRRTATTRSRLVGGCGRVGRPSRVRPCGFGSGAHCVSTAVRDRLCCGLCPTARSASVSSAGVGVWVRSAVRPCGFGSGGWGAGAVVRDRLCGGLRRAARPAPGRWRLPACGPVCVVWVVLLSTRVATRVAPYRHDPLPFRRRVRVCGAIPVRSRWGCRDDDPEKLGWGGGWGEVTRRSLVQFAPWDLCAIRSGRFPPPSIGDGGSSWCPWSPCWHC